MQNCYIFILSISVASLARRVVLLLLYSRVLVVKGNFFLSSILCRYGHGKCFNSMNTLGYGAVLSIFSYL